MLRLFIVALFALAFTGLCHWTAFGDKSSATVEQASKEKKPKESTPKESAAKKPNEKNKSKEITFDDLSFDLPKGAHYKSELLTDKIRELDGAKIKIRGFMLPSFQQRGITQFVLVRDNKECCFGPGAALYDSIIVELENESGVDFSIRPIAVEGSFKLKELKDPDGGTLSIYHLDGKVTK